MKYDYVFHLESLTFCQASNVTILTNGGNSCEAEVECACYVPVDNDLLIG